MSKLASILSSGFLKYGDKILNGLAVLSATKYVYNIGVGIEIERSGRYGFGKITGGAINVSNAVTLHNLSKKVASAREDKE